ncbi:hypothetical protein BCV70DRAFT_234709 [Testicularia cyperi]|uniref:Protein BIG1 n=1 Tax=Testicularia cyperi TaxID=1882483 RepID=A0A317XXF2_9BASI|nr:hypothetical protein BCV70DRAFT_234709 [Testicularia cyperi]
MKLSTVAGALASAALVSANTGQLLAFTSSQAGSVHLSMPSLQTVSGFANSLLTANSNGAICSLDAIAVVSVEHLRRDTYSALRHSSQSLRKRALDAPSQLTFLADQDDSVISSVSQQLGHCRNKQIVRSSKHAGEPIGTVDAAPAFINVLEIRTKDLAHDEELVLQSLSQIDEIYPRNLVIITQSPSSHPSLFKRQYTSTEPLASKGNWTEPTGGVFARYQLFSTPLLLTLLLVGGILLPIVLFAVSQLAQVQTPDQIGVRKDPVTGDKKTQ